MSWFKQLLSGEPHRVIGGKDDPYLRRWYLIPRNRFFNIYLHQFLRSDDDRALHDHPWPFMSIILKGRYWEHRADRPITVKSLRKPGSIAVRLPSTPHRVELETERETLREKPVWTLFFTGPRLRQWGFHCPQGWRNSREFAERGCE